MPIGDLVAFADDLAKKLLKPLPGNVAHEPLRATPIGSLIPKFEHKAPPKPGSVLILLYEQNGKIKFPLTKRPDYLGAHGGQISLPGGKAEWGEDYVQTALREGQEEIGIQPTEVKVIGRLSDFFVIPSNYIIVPVVAYALKQPTFRPQESEVEKILNCNLDDLLLDDAVKTKEILAAKVYSMRAPHFLVEGEVVWGATAMMLNELRTVMKGLTG